MPANEDELEEALLAFLAAYRRSRSRLHRDPGLAALTNAQFEVLRAVAERGQEGVGAVATAAGLSQPPATRAITRLESVQLVERSRSADDARLTIVTVTTLGHRLLRHHRRRLQQAVAALRSELPADRVPDAAALLKLLGNALDTIP